MSEKKVLYNELMTDSFFSDAQDLVEKAKSHAHSLKPDAHRMAGDAVVQGIIGHREGLKKALYSDQEGNMLLLLENTKSFLQSIGKAFADVDESVAAEIAKR